MVKAFSESSATHAALPLGGFGWECTIIYPNRCVSPKSSSIAGYGPMFGDDLALKADLVRPEQRAVFIG
jgi:hypothetical protein